jgi:hypothetical protein
VKASLRVFCMQPSLSPGGCIPAFSLDQERLLRTEG